MGLEPGLRVQPGRWTAASGEDWNLSNPGGSDPDNLRPSGFYSDGTSIWVADQGEAKVFKYAYGDKSLSQTYSLHSDNGIARGLWSDGTTAWVADDADDKLYAYALSDFSRDSGKDMALDSDNAAARGIWSDGNTVWVLDRDDEKVYAYTLSSGARQPGRDITLDADGENYTSIWSDGAEMFVVENTGGSATRTPAIHRLPLAPPTGLRPASGPTRIDLSWTATGDAGGEPISGYRVEYSTDGGSSWSDLVADTGSTSTTYSHIGLTAGTTYHYRVSAISAMGTGTASATASATTPTGGVTLSQTHLTVGEGSTATYTVVLDTQPAVTVTVTPASSDTGAARVSPSSVTFTTSSWNSPKTVTVRGVQDNDSDDETVRVSHAVSGGDYASVTVPDLTVRVSDNDRSCPPGQEKQYDSILEGV